MNRKRWIFTILLVVLFTTFIAAQKETKKESPGINERLEDAFREYNRMDRPGGTITAVKDGDIVLKRAFGLASMEHNLSITTATVMDTVEISRPVTAMAIFMLEDQGKLSLDDDIRKHIPELPDWGKTVTLRHLLDHTSGIWNWADLLPLAGWKNEDIITFSHVMELVKRQRELPAEPGGKYQFSNTNYNLLAETVTRVTGQVFRDWVRAKIFVPLEMRRTLFRDRFGEPVENQAYAYDYTPFRGYQRGGDNLDAVGSHCLYSSVEDMAKWMLNLETGKVGGKAVIEKMLTPGKLNDGKPIDFAGGFVIDTYKGSKRYRAVGKWGGFNSSFEYFPDQGFAVMMLCNWVSAWVNPSYVTRTVTDIYLEEHFKKNKPAAPMPPAPPKVKIKPDPASYDQYVGAYRLKPGDIVTIERKEDHLFYRFSARGGLDLFPQAENIFVFPLGDYDVVFEKNEKGKVCRLIARAGGNEYEAREKVELVNPTPEELQEYTGSYYLGDLDVRYSVIVRDKKLAFSHWRRGDAILKPETRDTFTMRSGIFNVVEFLRDKQGKISGFTLPNIGVTFKKTNK